MAPKVSAPKLELSGGFSVGSAGKDVKTERRLYTQGLRLEFRYKILPRLRIGLQTGLYYYQANTPEPIMSYFYRNYVYKTEAVTAYIIIPILAGAQYIILKKRFSPYVGFDIGIAYVGKKTSYTDYYWGKVTGFLEIMSLSSSLDLGFQYRLKPWLDVFIEIGALGAPPGGDLAPRITTGVKYRPFKERQN